MRGGTGDLCLSHIILLKVKEVHDFCRQLLACRLDFVASERGTGGRPGRAGARGSLGCQFEGGTPCPGQAGPTRVSAFYASLATPCPSPAKGSSPPGPCLLPSLISLCLLCVTCLRSERGHHAAAGPTLAGLCALAKGCSL